MRRFILSVACALMASASFAQNTRLVKGVVFDHEEIPMVGATVTVAGMSETFLTGENGLFEIYVSPYAKKVTIKSEGYLPQSAEIDGSYLLFKMKIDADYAKRKAADHRHHGSGKAEGEKNSPHHFIPGKKTLYGEGIFADRQRNASY